jgi:hypothetical protein
MSAYVDTMRTYPEVFSKFSEDNVAWNYLYMFCRLQGPKSILSCGEVRTARLPAVVMLERLRKKRCRDPQDHVFGVLGLTNLAGNINAGLIADYAKPVDEVFRDATRAIIEETRRLEVICSAQRSPFDEDDRPAWKAKLASWTPDWSEVTVTGTSLVHELAAVKLTACGNQTEAIYRFEPAGSLIVSGYLLGTIPGLAGGALPKDFGMSQSSWDQITDGGIHELSLTDEDFLKAAATVGTITQCVNMLYTMCGGQEPVNYYEGFVRTITVEWVDQDRDALEGSPRLMDSYINNIKQWYRRFCPEPQGDQERIFPKVLDENRTIKGYFTVEEYIALRLFGSRLRNRRYFVFWRVADTSIPGQIAVERVWQGLAPVTTRKEDCVCILPGCNAPVIMREVTTPDGIAYEVIGEAYVESLSHGEFEKLTNLKLQEFRLV